MDKGDTEGKKSKSTGRNTDKRRERSKVAARCRRGRECEIFSELASCLPLPDHLHKTLDKATIARLAVTHLKLNQMMSEVFGDISTNDTEKTKKAEDIDFEQFLNQAMGGFIFVLAGDGDLAYVSESVTKCLGLSQCEVMGQSIFDFTHPCDHEDIKGLTALNKSTMKDQPITRKGFFRMKCTITSKGRSVHLRAATYKGISCTGRVYWADGNCQERWFIGMGEPLSDPTDVNFPLNKQAFVTRHGMDMKCEDVAGTVEDFVGFEPEDLVGKSFYDFYHAQDGDLLSKNLKALYSKGQIQTERYRFLAKNGGWAWCITQATVIKSESGSKPNGIVCIHFVTSGIEHGNEIVSILQSKSVDLSEELSMTSISSATEGINLPDIFPEGGFSNPTPSTAKIFAPKTDDMDAGFLIPLDNTLIASKDVPEDLTHLAPTAGEDCVELCVPLLDDLLRSFDEANVTFSRSGNFIEVDSNSPFTSWYAPSSSEIPLLAESPLESSSPLFLNTDPQIMTPLVEPMTTFYSDQNPIVDQRETLMEESTSLSGFEDVCDWNELEIGLTSEKADDKLYPPLDELSEYRAPFYPADSGQDIELLYSPGDSMWPLPDPGGFDTEHNMSCNLLAPPGNVTLTEAPTPQLPTTPQRSQSKFSDQNIDQITWTLDIGSIFAARKPEDKPRVMTSSIFATIDSPPMKVRKLAVVPGKPRDGVGGTHLPLNADIRKCPFIKSCRTLELRENSGSGSVTGGSRQWNEVRKKIWPIPDSSPSHSSSSSANLLRKRDLDGSLLQNEGMTKFYDLTAEDYEMIVPLLDTTLLQGTELLNALDSVDTSTTDFLSTI